MNNYHADWYKMMVLVLFMLVVNVFLLNVFLAVVTSSYGDLVKDYMAEANKKSVGLLRTAFYIQIHGKISEGEENDPEILEKVHVPLVHYSLLACTCHMVTGGGVDARSRVPSRNEQRPFQKISEIDSAISHTDGRIAWRVGAKWS